MRRSSRSPRRPSRTSMAKVVGQELGSRPDPQAGPVHRRVGRTFGTFIDPQTKRNIGSYGINADHDNNLYMLDFNAGRHRHPRRRHEESWRSSARRFPRLAGPRRGSVDAQEPPVVRRIRRQRPSRCSTRRRNRSRNGPVPTPWSNPLRRRDRQERRGMDRVDECRTALRASTRGRGAVHPEYLLPNPTNIRARLGGQLDDGR